MIARDLAPARYWRPLPWASTKVKISDDARLCVVFLGICDPTGDPATFEPFASAFFLTPTDRSGSVYLITAKHCTNDGAPFWVRINRGDASELLLVESPDWVFHDDPTVDVAVMEFPTVGFTRHDVRPWYGPNIAEGWSEQEFGPGDLAHTVGLFHYHAGTNKNIPIVHSGHIAAFSGDERVRVRDWTRPSSDEYFEIDAYIVQCAAFEGASGSPVFVRKTASAIGDMGHTHRHDMERVRSPFGHNDPTAYGELYLLGLWHGHWQVDEVALTRGRSVSNPAGYGIVVPAKYIFRVMNMPKLKEPRDKILAERKAQRARKLPSADALPRGEAQKRFDGTLREMLNTPPNPKVTGK